MLHGEELINPVEKLKKQSRQELLKRAGEIQQAIAKHLNSLIKTGWTWNTSAGADFSITTPIAKVGALASLGAIYLNQQGNSETKTFHFAGGGGTVGWEAFPVPFNFDYALKDFYSSGLVFKSPSKIDDLTENDFRGSCLMVQAGAQIHIGSNLGFMIMGGNYSILLNGFNPDSVLQIVRTSNAVIPFTGEYLAMVPGSFGASLALCAVI